MIATHTRPATPNTVPRVNPNKNAIMTHPPQHNLRIPLRIHSCPSCHTDYHNRLAYRTNAARCFTVRAFVFAISHLFLLAHYFFYTFFTVTTFKPLYFIQKAHPICVPDSLVIASFTASLSLSLALCYFYHVQPSLYGAGSGCHAVTFQYDLAPVNSQRFNLF